MVGWLGKTGAAGTVVATLVNAGCCGAAFAPLVAGLSATGLLALIPLEWGMPLLYGALALTVVGAALGLRRHHRLYPLLVTLAGVVAILVPFHEALDVEVFAALLWTGLALLLLGAGFETWLLRRQDHCRSPQDQAPRSRAGGSEETP